MPWIRPFVELFQTGVPVTPAPVGRVRYDSVADVLYRSRGGGNWTKYILATENWIYNIVTGRMILAGAAAKTISIIRSATGLGTLGGHSASVLYSKIWVASGSGSGTLSGEAATSEEDA